MSKINKILLAVDSWMLEYDAGTLLSGLRLEGIGVIYYHVADYAEAITSSADHYNETILPGVGTTPTNQVVAERRKMLDTFLRHGRWHLVPGSVEVDIHPQPAARILEKAEAEAVDLVVLGIPYENPGSISKSALVEMVVRASNCLVLTPLVKARSRELETDACAAEPVAQHMSLNELRRDVYSTADYSPVTCEYCRHPLDRHTGRCCSICEIFPDSSIRRRCLRVPVSRRDNNEG